MASLNTAALTLPQLREIALDPTTGINDLDKLFTIPSLQMIVAAHPKVHCRQLANWAETPDPLLRTVICQNPQADQDALFRAIRVSRKIDHDAHQKIQELTAKGRLHRQHKQRHREHQRAELAMRLAVLSNPATGHGILRTLSRDIFFEVVLQVALDPDTKTEDLHQIIDRFAPLGHRLMRGHWIGWADPALVVDAAQANLAARSR